MYTKVAQGVGLLIYLVGYLVALQEDFRKQSDDAETILLAVGVTGFVAFLAASVVEVIRRPTAWLITALAGAALVLAAPLLVFPLYHNAELSARLAGNPRFARRLFLISGDRGLYLYLLGGLMVAGFLAFVVGISGGATLRVPLAKPAAALTAWFLVVGVLGQAGLEFLDDDSLRLFPYMAHVLVVLGLVGTASILFADDYVEVAVGKLD